MRTCDTLGATKTLTFRPSLLGRYKTGTNTSTETFLNNYVRLQVSKLLKFRQYYVFDELFVSTTT
jgi:hypothetical protein